MYFSKIENSPNKAEINIGIEIIDKNSKKKFKIFRVNK